VPRPAVPRNGDLALDLGLRINICRGAGSGPANGRNITMGRPKSTGIGAEMGYHACLQGPALSASFRPPRTTQAEISAQTYI